MAKFYSRNGGVKLSQMPFGEYVPPEKLPVDVLMVENYGDMTRFELKVRAKNSDAAVNILMGVIGAVYRGVNISTSPFSLFVDSEQGYNLRDFNARATFEGYYFHVIASGRLYYV